MNYYRHHIGDYLKKTAHLSMAEHGAYGLMLQHFYATEKPLPVDRSLYRLLRAETKAERAAVDSVIKQFWMQTPDGLVNKRAQQVLKEDLAFIEQARQRGRVGAEKRWGTPCQPYVNGHANPNVIPIGVTNAQAIAPTPTPNEELRQPSATSAEPKSKRKTAIPEDLRLSEAMREQALTRFPDADADEMFTQFRAHHEAHGKVMKSWPQAWVTWVGNAAKFGYPKLAKGKWL